MPRVTGFAVQGDGSRSFSVTVNGLRVLVTAEEGHHEDGAALAARISEFGPERLPVPVAAEVPVAPVVSSSVKKRDFKVGQRVWCNVYGSRGYCTVTEVGTGRNAGRIKIAGFKPWCPIHNFNESEP